VSKSASVNARPLDFARLTAAVLLALAAAAPLASAEHDREEAPPGKEPDRISQPLARMLHGEEPLSGFRIRAVWEQGGTFVSGVVFGTGVGVWNDRSQFRVDREVVLGLVRRIEAVQFGSMPPEFGTESDMLRMRGRVEVSTGEQSKTVVQLREGPQSPELDELASAVLTLTRRDGAGGATARSLEDGLSKLASGALEPEVFHMSVQRRSKPTDSGGGPAGWILRIDGLAAQVQLLVPRTGPAAPVRAELSQSELRDLAALLASAHPSDLPQNLYAPEYTDLDVRVLDQARSLQARHYLGVGPTTHGAKQNAFDRVLARAAAIEEKIAVRPR
jgi:hypothetical protein